jgi:hypothetical protein
MKKTAHSRLAMIGFGAEFMQARRLARLKRVFEIRPLAMSRTTGRPQQVMCS